MRPWGQYRLNRRMNEIERALTFTVSVLVLLLVATSIRTLEGARSNGRTSVAQPSAAEGNDKSFPTAPEVAEHRMGDFGDVGQDANIFLPGSISDIERTEVLHKCYIPSTVPLPAGQGCSISHKYKVIFHMTPKSGSSTGRHVIKADFAGEDHLSDAGCRPPADEKYLEVAVLRNPATRAFASYEEMFVRRLGHPDMIPRKCRAFMEPFRGWIYKNYSALFDTEQGVRKLNDAYERFMQDWDGDAFDMHLESQVAYNMRKNPRLGRHDASHLSFVFDTHTMEASFASLAKMVSLNKVPKVIKGRAYPRRLNVSNVSDRAFQAMCRRYRDDFCCLNYKLPPQCLRDDMLPGQRVRCKWVEMDGERLIQPILV
jgi:hypothetical protein